MQIHGTNHVHGPHSLQGPHAQFRGPSAPQSQPGGSVDRVEISPAAQAVAEAAESGEVRQEIVSKIRAQIAAGTYETPEKLGAAVDRLLDEIG